MQLFRPQRVRHIHGRISEYCNDPLQGGHILAHFKVDVIKQPLDNNFDKTSAQIQVGLNNPKPNAHIHGYILQSNLLLPSLGLVYLALY